MTGFVVIHDGTSTFVIRRDKVRRVRLVVTKQCVVQWAFLDAHAFDEVDLGRFDEKVLNTANRIVADIAGPDLPYWTTYSVDKREHRELANVRWQFGDDGWVRTIERAMSADARWSGRSP